MINKVKEICDGIQYSRDIPKEAKELAKENNIVVIVGGSDDLMYCYGADCYLTDNCEHSYGWDGDTLIGIGDKQLENEATQLGLMIWWCGVIVSDGKKIQGYNVGESGAFSYTVADDIESLDFKVMEDNDVYCTGIIIQLPNGFINSLKN